MRSRKDSKMNREGRVDCFEISCTNQIQILNPYTLWNRYFLAISTCICHGMTGTALLLYGSTLVDIKMNSNSTDKQLSYMLPLNGLGMFFATLFLTIFSDHSSKRPKTFFSMTLVRLAIGMTVGIAIVHFATPFIVNGFLNQIRMVIIGFLIQLYFVIGYTIMAIIWEDKYRPWIHAYNMTFYIFNAVVAVFTGFVYGLGLNYKQNLYVIYFVVGIIQILSIIFLVVPTLPYQEQEEPENPPLGRDDVESDSELSSKAISEYLRDNESHENTKKTKTRNLRALARTFSQRIKLYLPSYREKDKESSLSRNIRFIRIIYTIFVSFIISLNVSLNVLHASLLFSYVYRTGIGSARVASFVTSSYSLCNGIGTISGVYFSKLLSPGQFISQGFTFSLILGVCQVIFPANVITIIIFSCGLALCWPSLQSEFVSMGAASFNIVFTPFEMSLIGYGQCVGLGIAGLVQFFFTVIGLEKWPYGILGMILIKILSTGLTMMIGSSHSRLFNKEMKSKMKVADVGDKERILGGSTAGEEESEEE